MLLMVGIDPMRFAAACDSCGVREEPLHGSRPEVIAELVQRSWRIADEAKSTKCADCAGPPSVFPAGRLTATARQCSACAADLERCVACGGAFGPTDVVSCRKEHGHTHARCSTQKMPKLVPP